MNESTHQKESLTANTLEELFDKVERIKKEKGKVWFGISGSWRTANEEIEKKVRDTVQKIIERGDGIVSGGALNVDFFATDEALKHNPEADLIKIFLPVTLDLYAAHYRKKAEESVITKEQAEILIDQLERLKEVNTDALIENEKNTVVDKTTYYQRNTEVVNASDALLAFQVNESGGVGDTVSKTISQGKPVMLLKYQIDAQ